MQITKKCSQQETWQDRWMFGWMWSLQNFSCNFDILLNQNFESNNCTLANLLRNILSPTEPVNHANLLFSFHFHRRFEIRFLVFQFQNTFVVIQERLWIHFVEKHCWNLFFFIRVRPFDNANEFAIDFTTADDFSESKLTLKVVSVEESFWRIFKSFLVSICGKKSND